MGKADKRYAAVRTATRKYVRHGDGFEELYDLAADPYELDNKVKDPRYAGDAAMLRDLHDRLKSCVGAGCWFLRVPSRQARRRRRLLVFRPVENT